jgi:hypothetical protein
MKFKSAERITDPDKVRAAIRKSYEERHLDGVMLKEQDDQTVVKKGTSFIPKSFKALTKSQVQRLVEARGMPWQDGYEDRVIPYWGSDERVDGTQDIVLQNWNFDKFLDNSPMPYDHDWNQPPVGRIIDWNVTSRKSHDYEGPALFLLGMFATQEDYPWADQIFRLVKSKMMPGGSVGFFSDEVINIKDPKERKALGLSAQSLILDKNHLVEFSPTLMPCNSGAHVYQSLSNAKRLVGLKSQDLHLFRELKRSEIYGRTGDKQQWIKTELILLQVAKKLWPNQPYEFHKDLDTPIRDETDHSAELVLKSVEKLHRRMDELSQRVDGALTDILGLLEDKVESRHVEDLSQEETYQEAFENLDALKKSLRE